MRLTAVTILLVLALLAPVMHAIGYAQQEPLGASIDKAIEVWSGITTLHKSTSSSNTVLKITLGPDDIAEITPWGGAYVIVKVTNIDYYKGQIPIFRVSVTPLGGHSSSPVYMTEWSPATIGNNIFFIPGYVLQKLNDGAYMRVELFPLWAPDTTDPTYGVQVTRVLLAPPELAPQEGNGAQQLAYDVGSGKYVYIAMGAGAILLVLIIARAWRR